MHEHRMDCKLKENTTKREAIVETIEYFIPYQLKLCKFLVRLSVHIKIMKATTHPHLISFSNSEGINSDFICYYQFLRSFQRCHCYNLVRIWLHRNIKVNRNNWKRIQTQSSTPILRTSKKQLFDWNIATMVYNDSTKQVKHINVLLTLTVRTVYLLSRFTTFYLHIYMKFF